MKKLAPAVGYKGGKRALLPALSTFFPANEIARYEEPFVGMGAMYLHLRVNGFTGPAILCDAHEDVALFWRCVHDSIKSRELLEVAQSMIPYEPTREIFDAVRQTPCEGPMRVAHFLWLTNLSFANNPARYLGDRWRTEGSKFSRDGTHSAGAWGSCVERLVSIIEVVRDQDTQVLDDGISLLGSTDGRAHIFADPPYLKTHNLGYGTSGDTDFIAPIRSARAKRIVLSEKADLSQDLLGWSVHTTSVVQSASNGKGAEGRRQEFIYVKDSA